MADLQASTQPVAPRIRFIDEAKAIGIVLVVLGHAPGMPDWFDRLIFGFHMPLFFFAAGFLVGSRTLQLSWPAFTLKLGRDLGIPYLLFFGISYAYWLATKSIGERAEKFAAVSWYDPLPGFLLGMGDVRIANPVLWFFPCLAAAAVLYRLSVPWLSKGRAVVAAVLLSAFAWLVNDRLKLQLPFGLEIAAMVVVFYAIGAWFRTIPALWPAASPSRMWMPVSMGLLAVLAAAASKNGRIDLNLHQYGEHWWLFLPETLAGVFMTLGFSTLIRPNAATRWLARNTLTIFPVHVLVFNFTSGMAKLVFGQPSGFANHAGWGVTFALIAILTCVPVAWMLGKLLPKQFGGG